ncbi:MAG: hypothetical protein PHN92_12555 [Geobacter sp.]|nr:hypothetical protein [Geobacter sp.]
MLRFLFTAMLLVTTVSAAAEEFVFRDAEIEKNPWHLGGYAEARPGLNLLDRDAAQTRLRYYGRHTDDVQLDFNGKLLLEGSLEKDWAKVFLQPSLDYTNTRLSNYLRLSWYEAWFQAKPSDSFRFLLGKRSLRWGKGYAWNPVAFFDRPKNPDDPELSLEGYWLATTDFIQSFDGPLKTLAITPLLLPQDHDLNRDFGTGDQINWGGKLYFLLYDTDIDLIMMGRGSRNASYGLDFSRNLTTNFELHGELAWVADSTRPVISISGQQSVSQTDSVNWLLGARYLTEQDTTWIAEYYHNGNGYTKPEMDTYFRQVDRAWSSWQQVGSNAQLDRLSQSQSYNRIAPMRDYLYLRVSQKEPFDILYVTPAITTIANLQDSSFTITPELLYTGITNLELRLKGTAVIGSPMSEYGEKQNDARIELRVRYYF